MHHATSLISTISLEHNQPHLHTLTMSTPSGHARPIIIVTGANKYVACPLSTRLPTPALTVLPLRARAHSGIGFGICRRLLHGALQSSPDDARPLFPRAGADEPGVEYPCAGLTLVMACRNRQRAEAARAKLLEMFEDDVARFYLARRGSRRADGGAAERRVEAFRAGLVVAVHLVDLASVRSSLAFADEVARM